LTRVVSDYISNVGRLYSSGMPDEMATLSNYCQSSERSWFRLTSDNAVSELTLARTVHVRLSTAL